MDIFFDSNKRFKAEPEEVFIEDDSCMEETAEAAPNQDCFEYESTPTTSTYLPQYKDVPAILDGQFFEIVTVNETTCTALCKLCEPRRKTINGSLKATGNFYDHIKRMHISYMAEAETKRGAKRKPRTKKFDPAHIMIDHDGLPNTMFFPRESCTQEQAFSVIFGYVWETMQPPSIVDAESFRVMVDVLSRNNVVPISCPTSQQIQNALVNNIFSIRSFAEACLKDREYVCTAADMWRPERGSDVIGITGHTINPATFERESFALGFRFVDTDRKTEVAKEINDIYVRYNIQEKVQEFVTENLFKDKCGDLIGRFGHLEVGTHFWSFSTQLHLVVTIDCFSKVVSAESLSGDVSEEKLAKHYQLWECALTKLTRFWHCLKTAPRASIFCQQFCNKILPTPTDGWISRFEAVKVISETGNLHKVFNQLQLPPLEKEEHDYLKEYVMVMQPFVTAFDILKDTGSFRGVVLPTILSIKCRLEAMSDLNNGECLRLLALQSLGERFPMLDMISRKGIPFLIATISHPAFKMSCIPAEHHSNARDIFLRACSALSDKYSVKTAEDTEKDSFFSVLKSPKASVDCITNEALRYLTDEAEGLAMLHRYPCVKNIFLKYNTCLSSSAPVKRLLAPCKEVLSKRKPPGISDELFEDYLFMKISSKNMLKHGDDKLCRRSFPVNSLVFP